MKTVRNAARAVIIQENKLLAVRMRDQDGDFYVLPGGGQQRGETLPVALKRECREELGCDIEVGRMLYIREYIGKNHAFAFRHRDFHQVEAVFECQLCAESCPGNGHEMDMRQVGFKWIPLNQLNEYRFLPAAIIPCFRDGKLQTESNYLGDIN